MTKVNEFPERAECDFTSYYAGERQIPKPIESIRVNNQVELLRQEALRCISNSQEKLNVARVIDRIIKLKK